MNLQELKMREEACEREQEGMIRLDFEEHGSIEIPLTKAMAMLSDQALKDRIRTLTHQKKNRSRTTVSYEGENGICS